MKGERKGDGVGIKYVQERRGREKGEMCEYMSDLVIYIKILPVPRS